MWQELLMASRRPPAAAEQGGPPALQQQEQQIGGGGLPSSSDARRMICDSGSNDEKPCQAEQAALAAVRSVLHTWKTEQQEVAMTQQPRPSVACPVLGRRFSSNMKSFDDISTAASTEGGRGDVRTAAAAGVNLYAQEASEQRGMLQQGVAQQQPRTQQEQHEHFLASLQKLLQLLQEQQKQQGLKQQPPPQRGGDCEKQHQQPPAVSADASSTALLKEGGATAASSKDIPLVAAEAPCGGVNSNSDKSFAAGREVLQQLLSTSSPLSYSETYAFLQSVLRQQQQQLQREQQQQRQPPVALAERTAALPGEDVQEPWSSPGNSTCWSAKAAAAAAAQSTAEQQRRQQPEDSSNSSSLNPVLLLLGSPSPRYLPKRPRGSSGTSSWRSSSLSRSLEGDKEWCSSSSRNSSALEEEQQLYQDWLDHVHGVYVHRFDGTDEYRDDFDPGYRILDIPENEYIMDCSRFRQNPIELVGGIAACSRRPSPPPAALFTCSRVQLLSSSSSSDRSAAASALPLKNSDSSSTSVSAAGAAAVSREGHHCGGDASAVGEKPAAAALRSTLPPSSLQTAAAASGGEECRSSFESCTSRGSSPRFGSEAAAGAATTAGAAATTVAAAAEADQRVAVPLEKQDDRRSSPAWGEEAAAGLSGAAAAQRACNWFAECPVLASHHSSFDVSGSDSSCMQDSNSSSVPRGCSKEDEGRRQNSLFTSISTTSKNTSEREGCDGAEDCCRPPQGQSAGAEESEHMLKGSVSIEDELADCKVQLAPSSATATPCILANMSPVSAARCAEDAALAPVQQEQQQQSRYKEQHRARTSTSPADAASREYVEEMRRAAAWRECYCNGDAALYRRKQEQKKYSATERCTCNCSCCGRPPMDHPAEPLPPAAAALRGVAAAASLRSDAAAGGSEIQANRISLAGVDAAGDDRCAASQLQNVLRETAPFYASSGDSFYPVRVAGSLVLGFPRQQQQQQLRKEEERLLQGTGSKGHEPMSAGRGTVGSAAAADSPSERLLLNQTNVLLLQPAAAVNQRGGDVNKEAAGLTETSQSHISAATAVGQPDSNSACNIHCGNNRSTDTGPPQQLQQQQQADVYLRAAARGAGSSEALMQTREQDADRSSNCSCCCGCSACGSSGRSSSSNTSLDDRRHPNSVVFDCFHLKVVFERGKTGFEDHRELVLPSGTLFAGRYIVQQEVGRAAFSRCLRCIDTATKQFVCLKIIKNEKEYMDQSLDEVKTLRYLHANGDADMFHYVQLLDCFYHREHLVLVTELLSHNLYYFSSSLKKMKLPSFWTLGRVQRVARELLLALSFVHKLEVIHCDLKPENVLLRPSFLSDLALYKEIAGKHPLSLIREAAAAAERAAVAAAGGGAEARAASLGVGTIALSASGGTAAAGAQARRTAAAGGRQPTAGIAGGDAAKLVEERAAVTGGGEGGVVGGDYYKTRSFVPAAAQLEGDLESGTMRLLQSAAGASEQRTAAGGTGFRVSDDAHSSSSALWGGRSSEQQQQSSLGTQLQQQDCYERPKKQQYLLRQQQSALEQDLVDSVPSQQQVSEHLLFRQQQQQQQLLEQEQRSSSPCWSSRAEKETMAFFGSGMGSGSTVIRDGDVSTTATTAVPSCTQLPLPKRCGSSPLSSPGAAVAGGGSLRCSSHLTKQEKTAPAGAAEQGGVRRSLRAAAAAAAAAAAEHISVKLIDFGNSCRTSDALIAYVQSRSYRAPEVLLELPYGNKIDIWSLGCVLFELFTGVVLFMNEGVHSLLARIVGIIGQLPWYMVESSPKRHALFDSDGYLYTVIQTSPPFPASAPPALAAPGAGPAAVEVSAVGDGVSAAGGVPAAGGGGVAVGDIERHRSSAAETAAAAGDDADRRVAAGAAAAEKNREWQSRERLGRPPSPGVEELSSSSDVRRSSSNRATAGQQQQRGAPGHWEEADSRQRDHAGTTRETATAATAEGAGDKRIYERASQDPGSYCEDAFSAAATTKREGEKAAAGQVTGEEAAYTGAARCTRAAAGRTGAAADCATAVTGCTTGAGPGDASCFGSSSSSSRAVPEQQDCSAAPAAVTAASGGARGPPVADGLVKQQMKEGGRILRFLLPKRSSLKQRLRVDDDLFVDFLNHMLKIDPVERWSAEQLLLHPFLQKGLYADGL